MNTHHALALLLSTSTMLLACDEAPAPAAVKVAASAPATAAAAQASHKVETVGAHRATDAAAPALAALEAAALTPAPLQAKVVARLDAAPAEVWAYVSNNDNLQEYAAPLGIEHVELDHSNADANGVGVRRECTAMGDKRFVEEIRFVQAPYVMAYAAIENPVGMDDHLGVVIVRPTADGKTELEWRQHFTAGEGQSTAMLGMKVKMMTGGLVAFFTDKFGGQTLAS